MTPSAEGLCSAQPAPAGTLAEMADGKSVPVTGSGLLGIKAEQLDGSIIIPRGRSIHVRELGCNLSSERQLTQITEQLFSKSPWHAQMVIDEDANCFIDFYEESNSRNEGQGECCDSGARDACVNTSPARHHEGSPSDGAPQRPHHQHDGHGGRHQADWGVEPLSGVRRDSDRPSRNAEESGISRLNTGGAALRRTARADARATSLGESNYALIIVDDHSRFKVAKFLKSEDYTTAVLPNYIADSISLCGLTIRGRSPRRRGRVQRHLPVHR